MNSSQSRFDLFRCSIYLAVALASLVSDASPAGLADTSATNTHDLSREHSSPIRLWHHRVGDDPTWASPRLDLNDWEYLAGRRGQSHAPGIQWYRAAIRLEGTQDEFDILAISIGGLASAFELYWDGSLIGSGGSVASSEEDEISGPIRKLVRMKREWTSPGNHTIAIRLSNFHTGVENPLGSIALGYHYKLFYEYSYKSSHRVFVGGASLIAGLFCIAMFFAGSRHRSYLLFATYCLFSLFFDLFTILNLYNEINVEHIRWIIPLFRYGQIVSLLSLIAFVIFTYDIGRKKLVAAIAGLLSFISVWLSVDIPSQSVLSSELLPVLAGALLLYAIYRNATGSLAAFVGLVIWRIGKYPGLIPLEIEPHPLFYITSDIAFLFCIVLSISRRIHAENMQLQAMKLRSSRLEVDLLKKNIQPHFILNTLQSITSWIKKKPDNAYLLIEALAEEFRMINRIADKKLIPLHQEIKLCRSHLEVMGFRMGSTYELITDGLHEDDQVPPMIFHTLIENTLTHSFRTQERGTIRLSCERGDQQTVFRLSNNGSRLAEISRKPDDVVQEGMGLKYIRARLEESYAGRWALDYALDNELWEVTIVIDQRLSCAP